MNGYVPELFGSFRYDLIVSERIKASLERIGGLEFNPVVFETLVDVPMPPLGDMSWLNRPPKDLGEWEERPYYFEIETYPDVPEFHESIGTYYSVIGRQWRDPNSQAWSPTIPAPDLREVEANYGSLDYGSNCKEEVRVSKLAMESNPILFGNPWVVREDAFACLAPYIDRDYYHLAMVDLDPTPPIRVDFPEELKRQLKLED